MAQKLQLKMEIQLRKMIKQKRLLVVIRKQVEIKNQKKKNLLKKNLLRRNN